jgi:hypothetical protein
MGKIRSHSAGKRGYKQTKHKKRGSNWDLYINDQWVNSTYANMLPTMHVGAYTGNLLKVEYDNIVVNGYSL